MLKLLLLSQLAITADLRTPDPALERFSLPRQQEPEPDAEEPIEQEPDPEVGDTYQAYLDQLEAERARREAEEPSLGWRIAGWVNYLACGTVAISQEYRSRRSDWTAPVNNPWVSFGVREGGSYAVNYGTEKIRTKNTKGAWIGRGALGVLCAVNAAWNFNRGFFKE